MPHKDPERRRAYGRQWIRTNAEKAREAMRRWRARHPEEHNAETRAYYARHRERVKVRKAAYRKANRAIYRTASQRYRGRKQAASGSFSAAEWLALLARHEGRCAYCGTRSALVVEHRVPLSRGGTNSIENIFPACGLCNARKHRLTDEEFRARFARTDRLGDSTAG